MGLVVESDFTSLPVTCCAVLQLDKASRGGAGSKSSSVGGIGSMLPLLIVAVLAFLVGHFLQQGMPMLQQVVSSSNDGGAAFSSDD